MPNIIPININICILKSLQKKKVVQRATTHIKTAPQPTSGPQPISYSTGEEEKNNGMVSPRRLPRIFLTIPQSVNDFRGVEEQELDYGAGLPPLASFVGRSQNCQFNIYSWSALGKKKRRERESERKKNPTLFLPLHVSLGPLTVTLLDFGNLRPGVKMAASGESAHSG